MPNSLSFNEEDSAADIAIIGLGPAGLATALQAVTAQGRKVLAFTDRSEYTRGQRIVLTTESIQFLNKHTNPKDTEDIHFWKKYRAEKTVQIKDIEKFLYKKLTKNPNATIVHLNKEIHPTPIKTLGKGEDGSADFLETSDGQKYYFRHLVGADGAKHGTSQLVSQSFNIPINYATNKYQVRHPYHAVVQLKVKSGQYTPLLRPKEDIIAKMQHLQSVGWTEPFQPKFYIFPNAARTKFYFAGEIPQKIFEASNRERPNLLKQWAAKAIFEEYGISEAQLEYRQSENTPAKNKLQATVFQMNMEVCEKPFFELSNGVYAPIGDARRTPNYNFGHGLNDAIRGGVIFADACSRQGFAKEKFLTCMMRLDKEINGRMGFTQSTGKNKKAQESTILIQQTNALLTRLKKEPQKNATYIKELQNALTEFKQKETLTSLYDILTSIQPSIEIHKDTGLLYQAYRYIASSFDARVSLTKSAQIVEDIKETIEQYTIMPSLSL